MKTERKLLRVVHFLFTGGWIGGTAAMAFLAVLGAVTTDPETRRATYAVMSRLDMAFIVPLVLGSITSGVALAMRTPWGLFKHRWIVAKLVLAVAMVVFAVSTVMRWVQRLASASAHGDHDGLAALAARLVVAAVIFLLGLVTVVAIAVFKPGATRRQSSPLGDSDRDRGLSRRERPQR